MCFPLSITTLTMDDDDDNGNNDKNDNNENYDNDDNDDNDDGVDDQDMGRGGEDHSHCCDPGWQRPSPAAHLSSPSPPPPVNSSQTSHHQRRKYLSINIGRKAIWEVCGGLEKAFRATRVRDQPTESNLLHDIDER